MTAVIATSPRFKFFDNAGNPAVDYLLYTYLAGTTTPATTWQDKAQATENTNPIELDANGECLLWLTAGQEYKLTLKTAAGAEVRTTDNVVGNNATALDAALRADLASTASGKGAALVGWIQQVAGSVARTVASWFYERISLFDFMTDAQKADVRAGTLTLDVAAAVQAALTYASTGRVIIKAPDGKYKLGSAISVASGNNWGLVGNSSYTVEFRYAGASTTADIFTIGDGSANPTNVRLQGFLVASDTTMTAGIGIHLRRLCRSQVVDVIPDGQDGNGKLWHGIRFNGLDQVNYNHFQIRAQKDGLQVNGLVGSLPKAGLFISDYKIASCDVGVRIGGAFGGITTGQGDIAVCGDGVVIDTTLVAEANREVFFTSTCSIDACTRSGVVIDQATVCGMRVNFPSRMWIASHAEHGIWIKNANGAIINIDAYLYNLPNGDGVRIDDANAFVSIDAAEFNNISVGYGINVTVASTNVNHLAPRFYNVANAFNFTSNRATSNLSWPVSVQSGRAIYWDTYAGTLTAGGAATHAHSKGGNYYKQVIAVFASYKDAGNVWQRSETTPASVDGTSINLAFGAPGNARPYNVMVLVGDQANVGW